MHINTSGAIGLGIAVGVVAGIATVATIIAIDDFDLDTRVSEAITRSRMTEAERTELAATRRLIDHQAQQQREQRERNESYKRSKFRPDLLSGTRSELVDLSLSGLICEILHARRQVRHAWTADPVTGGLDYASLNTWTDQLQAMRSEFDRRRDNPSAGQALNLLERMRWQAAYSEVHAFDELTTQVPSPAADTTTVVAQS
ncbi:hypothetical protein [Nocardia sp. NPDC059228]|uniref:hypothetical protein n=1 Tax=Nocardia sp. NPDC059228 TaxID=3346777 RepID=UPI003695F296